MSRNPAGFFIRVSAFIIDYFLISTICGILIYFIYKVYPIKPTSELTWKLFYISYLTITPVFWGGYVIGKKICNIKIKRFKDDENVTIFNMFLREVVGKHILALVTFGMSGVASVFMVILLEDKRAIHDHISGTYVERK
ncbi:RDD family protein [Psychrobacillus sp. NEAU-3TGS]|uniref:RDD family protein n=1 Tax=Psychrobacillus sp. NEAU-3TGS TaxID=2995412 RepID=UPI002498B30F|nr:RDD family protein [Psychrobacillus sp. NEAU-3TGS]MDI2586227.1 RDD family protein [Psychrobacillus sp. NEAU-3TGS]